MSLEERKKFVFPENWDLSEIDKLPSERKAGRPSYTEEDKNRLYGATWFLERAAEATGIRKDLEKVFEGNKEIVDDIIVPLQKNITHL